MRGICPDCGKYKRLTKHSKNGGHKPPFIRICRECHDKRHNIIKKKWKPNVKIQRGSKYRSR